MPTKETTYRPEVPRPGVPLVMGTLFLLTLIVELALGFMNPSTASFLHEVGATADLALIPFTILMVLVLVLAIITAITAGAAMGKRAFMARVAAVVLFTGAAIRLALPTWLVLMRTFREGASTATSIEQVVAFSLGDGPLILTAVAAGLTLLGLLGLVAFGTRPSRRIRRLEDELEAAREDARALKRRLSDTREELAREQNLHERAERALDARNAELDRLVGPVRRGGAAAARPQGDADAHSRGPVEPRDRRPMDSRDRGPVDPRERERADERLQRDRDERARAAKASIRDERVDEPTLETGVSAAAVTAAGIDAAAATDTVPGAAPARDTAPGAAAGAAQVSQGEGLSSEDVVQASAQPDEPAGSSVNEPVTVVDQEPVRADGEHHADVENHADVQHDDRSDDAADPRGPRD